MQGKISARLVDSVAAKGATNAIGIYELLCEGPVRDSILAEAMNEYAEGLAHYFERRWKEAIGRFGAVLLLKGEDGPARLMINRCEKFSLNPPAADWEGVTKMHYK